MPTIPQKYTGKAQCIEPEHVAMNIGIDIDYTITEIPWFFAILSNAMRVAGHKIFVVSYREEEDRAETEQLLKTLGIEYDSLHLGVGQETLSKFKGRMAKELDIDVFFDDMPEAFVDMPDKVKRMWLCSPSVYNLKAVVSKLIEVIDFGGD